MFSKTNAVCSTTNIAQYKFLSRKTMSNKSVLGSYGEEFEELHKLYPKQDLMDCFFIGPLILESAGRAGAGLNKYMKFAKQNLLGYFSFVSIGKSLLSLAVFSTQDLHQFATRFLGLELDCITDTSDDDNVHSPSEF